MKFSYNMRLIKWILISLVLSSHLAYGATPENNDIGYLWLAELDGLTQKCNAPKRIKFTVADAIIRGKIEIGGITYFPQGRLEDSLAIELSLIRFYGDKRPLVSLVARADGTWNGAWVSRQKKCTGKVRVLPR